MKNNDNIIPLNLYNELLLTIHGIKFTNREIDVIAFIFHTRGSSKIASLLSISSRTVETHTANIMRKMDTNSREGIIDFLEKHGHSARIKKHYRALLLQINFKKRLQEVHNLTKKLNCVVYIVFDSRQNENSVFINILKDHFKLCGIHVALYDNINNQYLHKSEPPENTSRVPHILYVVSEEIITSLPLNEKDQTTLFLKFMPSSPQGSNAITYVLYNLNPSIIPNPLLKANSICFEEQEGYYSSFFKLLRNVVPQINLSDIITSFEKNHDLPVDVVDKEVLSANALQKQEALNRYFSKRSIGNLTLISATFLGAFYLGIYLVNHYKYSGMTKTEAHTIRSIRSDLIVPSKSTLLNRPNIITKIKESLTGTEGIQAVAIVGIGGAGKSTIARRYALEQKFNVVWEINAATRETLMDSFERLAYALCKTEEEKKILQGLQNIKNNVDRNEKILLFVKGKLKSHSNWFLIYDNVESFTNIRKYFPCDPTVWGNGKIIITTSNSNTKNNSLINNYIHIGELTPQEKLLLFSKIMWDENEQFSAAQEEQTNLFLNDIPPFPLDVSIAAYYLKSTNTPYRKYLERLKDDNKDFETIQIDVVKEASGYTKTRYNIITLSLIELIATHKDFRDLLLLTSLLDYKNIPSALLSNFKGDTVVDSFIYNLKKYSLITSETLENSNVTFSLHKTAQEIILAYLVKTLDLKKDTPLLQSIGNTMENYIVEAVDKEDFSKMKLLVPHVEAFLNHDHFISEPTKSSIGGALGCIYYYLRHNLKAKQLLEANLDRLNQYYADRPDKIARLLVYLGNFYRSMGDYEKAKDLLTQTLTIYKKHPNYLRNARALGYLGAVYRDLGNYQKSKDLLEQSLEIYKKNDENQIGHAWILAQLGNIYMILGDYPESRTLLEHSLAIYKKQGEDYIGVSWVLNLLGTLHKLMGDNEQAKDLLEQSLLITRKYFSDDHFFVASGFASLGSIYTQMGNHQKAKELLTDSLNVYEKNYGKDHIETARILRMLGEAYCVEGDMDTAEDLINKSLLVFQQKAYPESYKSLESLSDVYLKKAAQAASEGDLKQEQNFRNQSIHCLHQALEILNKCFSSTSPHIVTINDKLMKMGAA